MKFRSLLPLVVASAITHDITTPPLGKNNFYSSTDHLPGEYEGSAMDDTSFNSPDNWKQNFENNTVILRSARACTRISKNPFIIEQLVSNEIADEVAERIKVVLDGNTYLVSCRGAYKEGFKREETFMIKPFETTQNAYISRYSFEADLEKQKARFGGADRGAAFVLDQNKGRLESLRDTSDNERLFQERKYFNHLITQLYEKLVHNDFQKADDDSKNKDSLPFQFCQKLESIFEIPSQDQGYSMGMGEGSPKTYFEGKSYRIKVNDKYISFKCTYIDQYDSSLIRYDYDSNDLWEIEVSVYDATYMNLPEAERDLLVYPDQEYVAHFIHWNSSFRNNHYYTFDKAASNHYLHFSANPHPVVWITGENFMEREDKKEKAHKEFENYLYQGIESLERGVGY